MLNCYGEDNNLRVKWIDSLQSTVINRDHVFESKGMDRNRYHIYLYLYSAAYTLFYSKCCNIDVCISFLFPKGLANLPDYRWEMSLQYSRGYYRGNVMFSILPLLVCPSNQTNTYPFLHNRGISLYLWEPTNLWTGCNTVER